LNVRKWDILKDQRKETAVNSANFGDIADEGTHIYKLWMPTIICIDGS